VTVQAAHDMEILPRVLALGNDAQLLEPASARQRIGEMLRKMASAYV
jgi:predicted DNA-binding transcriptional regulator YafY